MAQPNVENGVYISLLCWIITEMACIQMNQPGLAYISDTGIAVFFKIIIYWGSEHDAVTLKHTH